MLRTHASALGAVLLTAVLVLAGCGSDGTQSRTVTNQGKNPNAERSLEPTPSPASAAGSATPAADGSVTLDGVTVAHAQDLTTAPVISAHNSAPADGLVVQDLVVGTGTAAKAGDQVSVQYVGALYSDGSQFDTSWGGSPVSFSLNEVVAGFSQGIGGTTGVEPMKVGGRRLMIFPAALGYGTVPQDKIPADSSLVFVVDLTKAG